MELPDRHVNHLGQSVGVPVPGWTPRERPPRTPMTGRLCDIEPIDVPRHAQDLYDAYEIDRDGRNWTYFGYGPFQHADDFRKWLSDNAGLDPFLHAIVDKATRKAVGVAAFMRIDPANGVMEVGHVHYSPLLQRTPAGTEAMYLMMRRAFDELGYRRYEWKCDSLNAPSRRAAERYGFTFEGIFRQAIVSKGRNRDTAWYALLDKEWPATRSAFEQWLAPENFDQQLRQRRTLSQFISEHR